MDSFKFDSFREDVVPEFVGIIYTVLVDIKSGSLIYSLHIIDAFKRRCEIHFFFYAFLVLHFQNSWNLHRIKNIVHHLFGESHIVFIISIDSVMFDLRELLQVTWI